MKITVKSIVSAVVATALTLAFGLAYAANDELPALANNKDTGTMLYESFLKHEGSMGIGSAAGGLRAEAINRAEVYTNDELPSFSSHRDIGSVLRDENVKQEAVKGSAPGGKRDAELSRSDEYTNDTIPTLFRKW